VQSRLRKLYHQHYSLWMSVLKHEGHLTASAVVIESLDAIGRLIERHPVAETTNRAAVDAAARALDGQLELLDGVHSEHEGLIIVPDTNALYWNPALTDWHVPTGEPFLIALTPLVIDELDRHKTGGATKRKAKAEKLIRQIGEYRRRGSLVDGVPLVNGVSKIFAVPIEANPRDFFAWLDSGRADDYFFASALSVMRLNPRAPTAIITADINLQNKIESRPSLLLGAG
jgi:hypothetical protein